MIYRHNFPQERPNDDSLIVLQQRKMSESDKFMFTDVTNIKVFTYQR